MEKRVRRYMLTLRDGTRMNISTSRSVVIGGGMVALYGSGELPQIFYHVTRFIGID